MDMCMYIYIYTHIHTVCTPMLQHTRVIASDPGRVKGGSGERELGGPDISKAVRLVLSLL